MNLATNSMSNSRSADKTATVAAVLAKLDIRPGERVLIMLPDGSGFAEAFAGTIKHGAVPLPVNPLLFAHEILAAAAESGARLLLASADQMQTFADMGVEPPVPINGPQRPWAAALALCSLSKTAHPPKLRNRASDHHGTKAIWRTGFRIATLALIPGPASDPTHPASLPIVHMLPD